MSFKPAKSRSLVLKQGKTTDKFRFTLGSKQIPFITEKNSEEPRKGRHSIHQELEAWLGAVNKSRLLSSRPEYTNTASSLGSSDPSWSTRSQYPQSRALRGELAGSYGGG